MKISILTMSRKRPKYLLETFESLASRASNNKNVEYIGIIDDDDVETREFKDNITNMGKKYNATIDLYETPRLPLEQYLNTGATVATGDVLFFIADDFYCEKDNWDINMTNACEKYLNEPFLIWSVGSNESWKPFPTFFGLSRKWVDITEVITYHRSSDEYARDVAQLANLRVIKLLDWCLHRQRPKPGSGHKILDGALEYDQISHELAHGYEGIKPSMSRHVDVNDPSGIGTKQLFEEVVEKLKNWKSYEKQ